MAATARLRSIAASSFRWDVPLDGVIDGANKTFTVPASEKFVQSGNVHIRVYLNGQRLFAGASNDYTVSESGGVGTGYDTVDLSIAPVTGDLVTVDFVIAV